MSDQETIAALRAALAVSPDNVPLRKHLAETLERLRLYGEAEEEYRAALALEPESLELKLALAQCFTDQSKFNESLVIVESLCEERAPAPEALIMHARLLLRHGDHRTAAHQYRQAVDAKPELHDEALGDELGVRPDQPWGADEEDDVEFGRHRLPAEEREDAELGAEIQRPSTSFAEVGGMDNVKEEIRLKIIHPLQHPEIYEAYGKKIGGGILMYGPPGCGKTHLARATAGEVHAGFLSIGIHDVLDMWLGNSEKQLHEVFQQARRNTPCVLFFDEVDALGAARRDLKTSGGRHLINQFLSELDGVESSNEGVLVLAATNAPWHLDSAFRRPGRFDRVIFVPPPDHPARAEILRILLTGKPTQGIDYEQVARKTDSFSGADLKAVVDIAVEMKLTQAMKEGVPQPIQQKDLLKAAKTVKPSCKEWFSSAKNYAMYANDGGIYDDILDYLKRR